MVGKAAGHEIRPGSRAWAHDWTQPWVDLCAGNADRREQAPDSRQDDPLSARQRNRGGEV